MKYTYTYSQLQILSIHNYIGGIESKTFEAYNQLKQGLND